MKTIMKIFAALYVIWVLFVSMVMPIGAESTLITNGGFESQNDSATEPIGWRAYGGWNRGYVYNCTDDPHAGNYCIMVTASDASQPFASSDIFDTVPGATYTVSVWVKSAGISSGAPAFKFEFYNRDSATGTRTGVGYGWRSEDFVVAQEGTWTRFERTFTTPENSNMTVVLLRLYGQGTVYFDDVFCELTSPSPMLYLETDNIFYYSDWTAGQATARPNTEVYDTPSDSSIKFTLKCGDDIIRETTVAASAQTVFPFNVSELASEKTAYTIEAELIDEDENVLETTSETIYRYDRPTCLNEDGVYITDGKPFVPVIGYHTDAKDFGYCAEAGINVVQSYTMNGVKVNSSNIPLLLSYLDEAEKHGIMVFVNLYSSTAAGSSKQRGKTIAAVNAVKDHPATFGYMIMDEPFSKANPNMYEDLKNSYIIIRNIDPDHPIYINEATVRGLRDSGSCCDILAVDPYPADESIMPEYVYDRVVLAKEAVDDRKPVYCLLQSFEYEGYLPDGNDIRHMIYQSLLAGADGIAYFDVTNSSQSIYQREDQWAGIKSFDKLEKDILFSHFIINDSDAGGEYEDEDLRWRFWSSGEDIYVMALNLSDEEQSVSITTGAENDSTVQIVNGAAFSQIDIENNILSINLDAQQAVLCRVLEKPALGFYNGSVLLENIESGNINTRFRFVADKNITATMMVALYETDGETQTFLKVFPVVTGSATKKQLLELENTIEVPYSETVSFVLKAFCWEDLNSMMPHTEAVVLK